MGRTLSESSDIVSHVAEVPLTGEMEELAALVADLREDDVLSKIQQHVEAGVSSEEILAACQKGMRMVGFMHEKGQYFIAGLIMAGEIMRQVVNLIRPVMMRERSRKNVGRVLLGTIAGDIHDIGKNLFKDLLECHGFTVLDLGVDVPPAEFLHAYSHFKPDLIAASALITDSFPHLRELVALFNNVAEDAHDRPLILIGGGQVDERVAHMIGSDYWAPDAFAGVRLCESLMLRK